MGIVFAGPWIGEFGWEIMIWVPYLRKLSWEYEKMYISTFEGVEALYSGFHCPVEFVPHGYPCRTDDWMNTAAAIPSFADNIEYITSIKQYKVDGKYVRYGSPVVQDAAVLFHARGIRTAVFKNWAVEKWAVLAEEFPSAISIGSKDDLHVPGTKDARGLSLGSLMDLIASASIVIGQSSGVMHLASMCGTQHVVWADSKTYFSESLEKRYKETWNPFGTPVIWIDCDNWDPEPRQIMTALKPKHSIPDTRVLSAVYDAVQSGQYIIGVAHMGEKDNKPAVIAKSIGINFPDGMLEQAEEHLTKSVRGSIAKAKAERMPVSWR
jgi:hypothetical protein